MAVKTAYAMINGVKVPAIYDEDTGLWTVETSAPADSSWSLPGHVYEVTLHAEDEAGNSVSMDSSDEEYGDQLKIRVLEKTAPNIAFANPSNGSIYGSGGQSIIMFFKDEGGSGLRNTLNVDEAEYVKIDGNVLTMSSLNDTYGASATSGPQFVSASDGLSEGLLASAPSWAGNTDEEKLSNAYLLQWMEGDTNADVLSFDDGMHTIEVAISDNDGNVATATVTFAVSTAAPALEITSPADNLITNDTEVTVSGRAKAGSSVSNLESVTVNGQTVVLSDADEDGYRTFSTDVSLTENAVNIITIVAKDNSGAKTSVTRTVVSDISAPVITDVIAEATTVDAGGMIKITFKVVDANVTQEI